MQKTALEAEIMLREALSLVTAGENLSESRVTDVVDRLMECDLEQGSSKLLASALICSLKTRGETVDEIVGAAQSLRQHQRDVTLAADHDVLLDTCGTGGDGAHLINISTITGIVVASLGVTVAKHGNRSVSSSCGSADLLEAMGYPLFSEREKVSECVRETGFGFLFAPHFHPALKNLSGLRRALGVRTIFNMLGPLVNPAGATHQLIGVFDRQIVKPIASAAARLGLRRCAVVHGEGGLDELSPTGKTWVAFCHHGKVEEFSWTPSDFGAKSVPLQFLAGGDAAENAAKTRDLLAGKSPEMASAVAMNCSAALWVVEKVDNLKLGYSQAYEALMSGAVGDYFESTKTFAAEQRD